MAKGKPSKQRYRPKKGKGKNKPKQARVTPRPVGKKQKHTMKEILEDPILFISRLKIVDKKGKTITLKPTPEQTSIIKALQTGDDVLVLKPRQIGSSTISCAYLFWKFYTTKDSQTLAILSHKLSSAKHLLEICKRFYYLLPPFMQKDIELNNTTTFQLTDSGAQIIAASAEGKGGLRSFTCSHLMISEYAFSPNPEELKATALAALNNGQLIIESTASHYNDALHQEIMRVDRGIAKWNFLFFKWSDHTDYKKQPPPNWVPTEEELDLMAGGLHKKQVYWRHDKISKIGYEKFIREYPLTIEEAYAQTGNSYFSNNILDGVVPYPVDANAKSIIFHQPSHDDKYAIGVDVAAGVKRDYSSVYVMSKRHNRIEAIYRRNEISPVSLAWKIIELARQYHDALVLVESNNYGNVVLNEMRHQGYNKLWLNEKGKEWLTTGKSKKQMFENAKAAIADGHIKQVDNILMTELRSLQVNDHGTIIIPDNLESHGDNAIAFALSVTCLQSLRLSNKVWLPKWIRDQKTKKTITTSGAGTTQHRRY